MSDGVTQFVNALQIVNNTGSDLSIPVQANGYKQLFSPSWTARNVPDGPTSDGYTVNVAANGGAATIGAGIYRNGDFDQSAFLVLSGPVTGRLTFDSSQAIDGSDILQNVSWSGATNVSASTVTVRWNFNNKDNQLVTLTIK